MAVTINGTTGVTTNNSVYTDASGNTGINTGSPAVKLHVIGPSGVVASAPTYQNQTGMILENNFHARFAGTVPTSAGYEFALLAYGAGDAYPRGGISMVPRDTYISFLTGNGTTNILERARIDGSGYMTSTVNGNGAGLVQGQQYYRLNAALAGANATGAQSLFGVGVTLVGSTVYEFEIIFAISKTAGTTSHTVSVGFGGTATLNNIGYEIITQNGSAATAGGISGASINGFIATATATAIDSAQTSAAFSINGTIKGTVSINAGGTFIPQYSLSAAPGGAYSTQIGSYIKISALSASGANTSIGTWA